MYQTGFLRSIKLACCWLISMKMRRSKTFIGSIRCCYNKLCLCFLFSSFAVSFLRQADKTVHGVLYVWVIDQVWGQDGWILAKFFFCVFMDRDEVEVHKLAKQERASHVIINVTLGNQKLSSIDWLAGYPVSRCYTAVMFYPLVHVKGNLERTCFLP